jgi:AraC family transcriptional regulator
MRTKNPLLLEEHTLLVNQSIDYIRSNISHDIHLADISSSVSVSPSYLHRMFKRIAKQNVNDYIIRKRLDRALHMLLFWEGVTLSEIASYCGFSSLAVFSRTFKTQYDCSPTIYAEKHRIIKSKIHQIENKRWESYFSSKPYNQINEVLQEYKMRMAIRRFPARKEGYIRCYEGDHSNENVPTLFHRLSRLASNRGLWRSDTVLYGRLDYPWYMGGRSMSDYYEACLTLPEDVPELPNLNTRLFEGGDYAVIRFEEPEHALGPLMMYSLTNWLPSSGYLFDIRPTIVIHYNDPSRHPDNHAIVDYCLPVRSLH